MAAVKARRRLAVLVVEAGRQDDADADVEVAGALRLEARHALAGEAEDAAVLGLAAGCAAAPCP